MNQIDRKACAAGANRGAGRRPGRRADARPAAGRQRGISTILVMLMLGLGVGVSALSAFHVLNGAQQRQLSVHATAPAQATAWRGVELVRRYLQALPLGDLEDWEGAASRSLAVGDAGLGIQARVTEVVKVPGSAMVGEHFRVTAEIGGTAAAGGTAQTTSTVQVVYKVRALASGEPPPTTPPGTVIPAATINTNFTILGTLDIIGSGSGAVAVNVRGDVKGGGDGKLDNVDILRATGSVSLDNPTLQLDRIHANGDVLLEKGARADEVHSRGKVELRGEKKSVMQAVSVRAHGNVVLNNVSVTVVQTRADLLPGDKVTVANGEAEGAVTWTATDGRTETLRANGAITYAGAGAPTLHTLQGATLQGAAGAGEIRAKGNIGVAGGAVAAVRGEGNLSVGSGSVAAGTVRGSVSPRNSERVKVTSDPDYTVAIEPVAVPEVPEVSTSVKIDVYPLRAAANYVFEQLGDGTRVTVGSIAGLEDGAYWLVGGALCARPGALDGACAAADTKARICDGGACFSRTDTGWSLSGNTLARGIIWLDGDLTLKKGQYVNTFVATGDITTDVSTMAPNYAGYAAMCTNAAVKRGMVDLAKVAAFEPLVPTNLCDLGEGKMISNPLGNVAYLAGGYVPTEGGGQGAFTGGDITLNVNNNKGATYGAVMAANNLTLQGNNVIHGPVTVGAQSGNLSEVKWNGTNVINLSGGSEDYSPGELPCMSEDCAPEPPPTSSAISVVLGTRYL